MTNLEKIRRIDINGVKPFGDEDIYYLARFLADRLCKVCGLPEDIKIKHCYGTPYCWDNCVMAWKEWLEQESDE